MKDLPKPAFTTEEEVLEAGETLMKAGDTTAENVEAAVILGTPVADNELVHVRYVKKDGDLLYHVFRGPDVPDRFWGTGQFGLVLLSITETLWAMDTPKIEFDPESVRVEAVEDDPRQPSKYPDCYYSAYSVLIRSVDAKPVPPDEKRIKRLAEVLVPELKKAIAEWSNGS